MFDYEFIIITKLADIYALKGDVEFIRLTREYYSLRYEEFGSIIFYLIYIKILEEYIRGINVTLDNDK